MIVKGWDNGSPNNSTGSGYGIRLSPSDRDKWFRQEWSHVTLHIEGGGEVEANLAPSFWRRCTELRHKGIGRFLIDHGLAPWPKGSPPRLKLEHMGGRHFRLSRVGNISTTSHRTM
jgi:hypothetical protein